MILDIVFNVLFSVILKVYDAAEQNVLATREGIVRNETFVYLYVYHQGNIILSLKSLSGDADLFISDSNLLPSFDVQSYDLHSATCGNDMINIPKKYGSPISVGIYGHHAYETSSFVLEVLKKVPTHFTSVIITHDIPDTEVNRDRQSEVNSKKPQEKPAFLMKSESMRGPLTVLFNLLDIFILS